VADAAIEQRINEMVSGVRQMSRSSYRDDIDQAGCHRTAMERALGSVPGCVDLATEQIKPAILQIKVDQESIARYGVSARSVPRPVRRSAANTWGKSSRASCVFPLTARLPEKLAAQPAGDR